MHHLGALHVLLRLRTEGFLREYRARVATTIAATATTCLYCRHPVKIAFGQARLCLHLSCLAGRFSRQWGASEHRLGNRQWWCNNICRKSRLLSSEQCSLQPAACSLCERVIERKKVREEPPVLTCMFCAPAWPLEETLRTDTGGYMTRFTFRTCATTKTWPLKRSS